MTRPDEDNHGVTNLSVPLGRLELPIEHPQSRR
jgi:hypothetical protein